MTPERGPVRFTFDGRTVTGRAGQSVAAALLEAGQLTLTRSAKYRRPRGIHCAAGHCPNCMLRVDGAAHVRTCMVEVRDGARVETEGTVSRRIDPLRAIDRSGPLFPVGFQYRYFKRQNVAWRIWEGRLRKAAADTEVPPPSAVPPAERMTTDLLVAGGGIAGLGAAAEAARAGLRVVVCTRRGLGGRLRPALGDRAGHPQLAGVHELVTGSDAVSVLAPATVIAAFGDQFVVDAGDRVVEVTARASVLATGAYERAVTFAGNDRPGVMLTSALHRLVREDGVLAGRAAVIVAADDEAYALAAGLAADGLVVPLVVDVRRDPRPAAEDFPGEVVTGATDVATEGRARVEALAFTGPAGRRRVRCDVVGMSGGWQAADELRFAATSGGDAVVTGERGRPLDWSEWRSRPLPVLQAVGAAAGTRDPAAALAEGELAGAWAAASLDARHRPAVERAVTGIEAVRRG